jgi:hypothetical protein
VGDADGEVDHTKCVVDTECIYDETDTTYTCTACAEGTTRAVDSVDGCGTEDAASSSIISFSVLLVALLAALLF